MGRWIVFMFEDYEAMGGMNDCAYKGNVFTEVLKLVNSSNAWDGNNLHILDCRHGEWSMIDFEADTHEDIIFKLCNVSDLSYDRIDIILGGENND